MGLWGILNFWLQGVTPLRLTALSYWDFIFFYLQPVKAKVRLLSGEELLENGGMLQQVVQLSHLQKLLVCSYSTLLFVQWVPLNRHLPYADAWSKLPLDLLFCTHRNHDFSRVFRPSGPLVHPALQISCYEVTECFYTFLDEMLLRRRVPTPAQTIYTIHTIYTNIQTIYTPGWRETVRVKLKSCVRA